VSAAPGAAHVASPRFCTAGPDRFRATGPADLHSESDL